MPFSHQAVLLCGVRVKLAVFRGCAWCVAHAKAVDHVHKDVAPPQSFKSAYLATTVHIRLADNDWMMNDVTEGYDGHSYHLSSFPVVNFKQWIWSGFIGDDQKRSDYTCIPYQLIKCKYILKIPYTLFTQKYETAFSDWQM